MFKLSVVLVEDCMFWLNAQVYFVTQSMPVLILVVWYLIWCSSMQILVDMIRVPDWAFEAVGLEMRVGQDTAYHPGLYLSAAQVS